ncbi:hypothetical protein AAVH_15473 [Aphelenchoides avenae]|nr:hypothetical protein AAVH_15473 [Aphelenchus avenae]
MIGFCLGIGGKDDAERAQRRSSLTEQVREIMKHILDARSVLSEVPPTTPTMAPDLPSSGAAHAEVTSALANTGEDLASRPWRERPAFYDKAIQTTVQKLMLGYNSRDNGTVNGVIYLPYEIGNRGLHCAHAVDNGSYWGSVGAVANYFVKYSRAAADIQTLKEKFVALEAKKDRIIEAVFAESQDDLCKQVQFALGDQRSKRKRREAESVAMDDTAFTALVAVKCNYDFVWYELGWRYYTAARTTTEYVLEKNDGTFDASCGQIIFIP